MRSTILRLVGAGAAVAAASAVLPTLAPATGSAAVPAAAPSAIQPVRRCAELTGGYPLPGAVTHVQHADEVAASGTTPAYCDVTGYVEPAVRFHLKLPLSAYSGRYLQYGCDGLCGLLQDPEIRSCAPAGTGDVAVATTDDGHTGQGQFPFNIEDGTWAANDQAARDDYFFRAPHVTSVAAKRIITAFYGAPPVRSYFMGCSTGGREGLLLAQRYPHDFDGIAAGAPTNAMGPLVGMYMAWLSTVDLRADGTPILTADKVQPLHDAVVAACDGLDGLADGQLDDPRACHYDPVRLQCPVGTDTPVCLTRAQVAVARALYRGPVDVSGRRLYPGWQLRGSEFFWTGSVVPIPGLGSFLAPLPDNYLRYVGYPIGTPHSSLATIRFTVEELRRLTPEGVKGNALALDLSEFRKAGGKLIVWHGWADHGVPPVGTLDYFQRLTEHNGGPAATSRWARLFMVPAKHHCQLPADKPNQTDLFDPFPALAGWVEHGTAPDRIISTRLDYTTGTVLRTRPVYPYPLRAAYNGTGSIDDADSFHPVAPATPPHDAISWAGEDLYYRPGPVAP
jgi:feruloyl esterase